MEQEWIVELLDWFKNVAAVFLTVFGVYKMFFEKKKNDISLGSEQLKFLKEHSDLRDAQARKLLEDFRKIEEKSLSASKLVKACERRNQEFQQLLDESNLVIENQRVMLAVVRKANTYYRKKLDENNISYNNIDNG